MAKRSQADGVTGKPSYEDFQPMAEWKEEEENNILTVHLPDFSKDKIQITCVRSSRIIRVQGERQVADKKWSRFNQLYQIPQNCNIEKIHAKWQNGVLTITMPKETVTKLVARKEEEKTRAQKHPFQPQAVAGKEDEKTGAQKPPFEPKADAGIAPESAGIAPESSNYEQRAHLERQKEAKPQKGKDETSTQVASSSTTNTMTQREAAKAENVEKLIKKERNEANGKPEELKRAEDGLVKSPVKEKGSILSNNNSKSNESTVAQTVVSETSEKEKEKKDKSAKAKPMKNSVSTAVTVKKAMKALAMEKNNEDRQLMINMGVAVLVIVALGAYVSYSFGSKAKD